jgi:hypothetical protein
MESWTLVARSQLDLRTYYYVYDGEMVGTREGTEMTDLYSRSKQVTHENLGLFAPE